MEWKRDKAPKQPYYIQLKDQPMFGFAGLYNEGHASIFTTSPNDFMEPIHSRMPVILPADKWLEYLVNEKWEVDDFGEFLQPYPSEQMTAQPISKAIGNVQNNHAELLEPIDTQGSLF